MDHIKVLLEKYKKTNLKNVLIVEDGYQLEEEP